MKGISFVGSAGAELDQMLLAAGIDPQDCFFTCLAKERVPQGDLTKLLNEGRKTPAYRGLHIGSQLAKGIADLYALIKVMKPTVIIGCGNYPLWALTEYANIKTEKGYRVPLGVGRMRGSMVYTNVDEFPPIPYLPINHPSVILRNYAARQPTIVDLGRVHIALRGKWKDTRYYNYVVSPDLQTTLAYLDSILGRARTKDIEISVDIETVAGLLRTIAIADTPQSAICIPFVTTGHSDPEYSRVTRNYWGLDDLYLVVDGLRTLFSHPRVKVIGQNFLYDLAYITLYLQVVPKVSFDTMLAQHLAFPGTPKSLDYLASLYCKHYVFWKDDLKDSNEAGDDVGAFLYNCEDAVRTFEIARVLKGVIRDMGLGEPWAFQMSYFWTCFFKNSIGVRVDQKARFAKRMELVESLNTIGAYLESIVPEYLVIPAPKLTKSGKPSRAKVKSVPWYTSAAKTAKLFYEKLGFKPVLHKKTKQPTVDDTALVELAKRYPALGFLFQALQLHRSLGVFFNNFLSAELDADGRMRSSFNLGGTETFRLSSSQNAFGRGLNLQNIPSITEE